MLIEFRVENFRSLRDEQVLTLEAGRNGDAGDDRPRRVRGHERPLLPAAALYGANGSGKSNVLAAMGFMRQVVVLSHRLWPPEGGVPQEPFAWGEAATQPSLFEVTMLIDGVRYRYGFVVDDQRVVEEWLFAWPRGRRQVWFEREEDEFTFGEHLKGENRLIEQITRSNALFLAAAAQHGHQQLALIYRWFRSWRVMGFPDRSMGMEMPQGGRWLWQAWDAVSAGKAALFDDGMGGGEPFVEGPCATDRLAAFKELLQAADIGIVDFKVVQAEMPEAAGRRRLPRRRVLLRHRSSADDAWLSLDQESQGTRALFRTGPAFLEALWAGSVVVIDELEASLHPLLALQILRQFNDARTNPRHAQLLFTTHDTNLLGTLAGEPPLRRDQIWLTEKDHEGASCLYPLTDYKPRKAENMERGYLQGRYGAIPFLGELTPVRDAD